MLDSTGTYMVIDCAAPFFFFDVELPSGRTYSKTVADYIIQKIEEEDVPIQNEDGTCIGYCVGANIIENGVAGRMILLPKFREEYAENWNMTNTYFSPVLKSTKTSGIIEDTDIEEFCYILAYF